MNEFVYDCDECGACCRHFIVEADLLDALREPRIAQECKLLDGNGELPLLQASFSIAIGIQDPCPFLSDNRCAIHATKPTDCVSVQAGDAKCREARSKEGLPPLIGRTPHNLRERIMALSVQESDREEAAP